MILANELDRSNFSGALQSNNQSNHAMYTEREALSIQQPIQMSFDHHGMGLEQIVALTATHTFWPLLVLQYNVMADPSCIMENPPTPRCQINPQIKWSLYRREY
jgi:hypothetical protein